jgi:Fumarylacetoacetate (FAA) hydrolase family
LDEIADWLGGALSFPVGVIVLTGTGVVPEPAFTLRARDVVRIEVDEIGILANPVTEVGEHATPQRPRSGLGLEHMIEWRHWPTAYGLTTSRALGYVPEGTKIIR